MLFNSLSFLILFVTTLALGLLPLPWTFKKVNLLIASYLFYAAWSPPFVLLLVLSAVVDFGLAHLLGRTESPLGRKSILACSLALNLGLLAFFKYGVFLLENVGHLLGLFGYTASMPTLNVVLPLGISFYTFETISYLIDVYRRRIRPTSSFLDYALFLTFFPHLVAGPIVRAADFLPQCEVPRKATLPQFGWGAFLMLLGLFEKVFLADRLLAPVADRVFAFGPGLGVIDAWCGAAAFAGQIFFDFAGYSTCGIGAALCLGFELKLNFHFPYGAVGFSDFWRRWHISLSSWLQDYLYIPLGGSRHGSFLECRNLMITMLLGGLWHGASWQFVIWGGLHGVYLLVERLLRSIGEEWRWVRHRLLRPAWALGTFILVLFTWVYFRATSLDSANQIVAAMLGTTESSHDIVGKPERLIVCGTLGGLLLTHWLLRDTTIDAIAARLPWLVLALLGTFFALVLILLPGDDRAFIYFQF